MRKVITVKGAKGRKDRQTLLSQRALEVLRQYWRKYRPNMWLFPRMSPESHITARTVELVFKQAKVRAGIRKDVTVHSLRHSFATHLLERGTDIRYIQESTKTTEIYTHVSKAAISKIKNPLESLDFL